MTKKSSRQRCDNDQVKKSHEQWFCSEGQLLSDTAGSPACEVDAASRVLAFCRRPERNAAKGQQGSPSALVSTGTKAIFIVDLHNTGTCLWSTVWSARYTLPWYLRFPGLSRKPPFVGHIIGFHWLRTTLDEISRQSALVPERLSRAFQIHILHSDRHGRWQREHILRDGQSSQLSVLQWWLAEVINVPGCWRIVEHESHGARHRVSRGYLRRHGLIFGRE